MIRIGIVINLGSPTTDYYRSINPFLRLRREIPIEITYLNPDTVKWYDFYNVDVVIFQRPNGDQILGMISEAKKMGKKIILDHDDLLHEVNDANPSSKHFNNEVVKKSVERAFKYADHVITSTPYLKTFYKQHYIEDKITVIPNAIDLEVTPFVPVKRDKTIDKIKRVLWRGSMTHIQDLQTVDLFWKWLLAKDSVEVAFMGLPDWLGKTLYPKAFHVPWNNSLFQYFDMMKNSNPHYGIFPLTNDNFNQAKSNNFAMEMLVAGCVPYAPKYISEFNIEGVRLYDNQNDLKQMFEKHLEKDDNYFLDLEAGRNWIKENRDLNKVNQLRLNVLNSL